MLRLSGTKLHFTTAYHPQSDGQTEVRNRGLEQYLRAFTADKPSKWTNFLPWAELALNCFHHSGLGTSPFHALYGREPPLLVAAPPSQSTPPAVADHIRQRGDLLVSLRSNLERAQQRMRDVANKHRRDVQFSVGDSVLLKLQQYRQHSVARPQSAKLARRYYGPFTVTERIGPVAYRLELPPQCRIHNVFHVSLLRPFVQGTSDQPPASLPEEFFMSRPVAKPIKLLDRRVVMQNGMPVNQGLVQWSDADRAAPTWEPISFLTRRFPSLFHEDKVSSIGGRVNKSLIQPAEIPHQAKLDDRTTTESLEETMPDIQSSENVQESSQCDSRARRIRRPPARFQDYVDC